MGDKWTLLIIRDLVPGPRRFVELQRVLPGISTEQLRSRLNRMVADGLLTRRRYREVPPRVDYELTERSRELVPVIAELSRWGYAWAWGPPREAEAIDIGAIFRSAPGLIEHSGRAGSVQLRVDDRPYTVAVGEGSVSLDERVQNGSDATVSGTEAAWIAALGPDGDRSGLSIDGDDQLAEQVLDGVCPIRRTAVRAA